jgi:hypothetical protein
MRAVAISWLTIVVLPAGRQAMAADSAASLIGGGELGPARFVEPIGQPPSPL